MIITALSSLRAHASLGEILWPVFLTLCPGIFVGTLAGALLTSFLPVTELKILFAVFLVAIAFKMLADIHVTHVSGFPSKGVNTLVSFLIGFKSGLLGVGGGVLVIPYLTYCGVALRNIAAISNLCTLTVALVGSCVFIMSGWQAMQAVPYATGYVYWPAVLAVALPSSLLAPLGAQLSYKVGVKPLKYGFIILLLITALRVC
jgi:uncharacterized membrane protein YfcA